MGLKLLTTALRPAIRQASTSTMRTGRKIEVEPISVWEKIIPAGSLIGMTVYVYGTRGNAWQYHGIGWIGEIIYRICGKAFYYRKPIADQIKEQKLQDYKRRREFPWRIWVS